MKISQKYSHLNGEEYLIVHHNKLYKEIKEVIKSIDANKYKTKISKEKTKTGIKALRIEYNRVLGYYIQVGKNYQNLVPDYYVFKSELTSGKRYITSELKEYEAKILNAKDQINQT